jgi:thiol-disulfide isomerase/thioredoxin
VATQTAPACRGFQSGRDRLDSAPYQRAGYPEARRLVGFQSISRRNFAIPAAAWALVCLAAPAFIGVSKASQSMPPTTLKIWEGAGKPAFSLDDLHGNRRDLQALAGKVTLVHFFATWCGPCVREISSLQRLAEASRDKPLAIIAVDVAEVDLRVRAFFEKRPVDFTVLLDRDRAVSRAWDVTGLPTSFLLDTTLAPRFSIESDLDWSRPDVLAAIGSLYSTADRPQGKTISSK